MVELGGKPAHGKILGALAPSGSGHDRILVLCLANKDQKPRPEMEEAGGNLALKLEQLGVESACVAAATGGRTSGRAAYHRRRAPQRCHAQELSFRPLPQ
ncbi:MAG: hypothetical protein R3C97_03550 [Geminicoccaceae bacterium]